uniref:NADH dehydrogenase subunit 4 n=1 Tax=Chilocorus rubidus TaxID=419958 RepID=UPI00286D1CC3|nr:NADH dehydrogenase subunit 4 [Chilocorus rubidus]WMB96360.1 NADH dehydrogenase subunit 4 [Chilocorus rubidus]
MMKFIFALVFLMFLSFSNFYWMIYMGMIFLSVYFIFLFPMDFMSFISFNFGYDLISYFLILLSLWISFLMILASEKIFKLNIFYNLFIFLVSILLVILILTFMSLNMFLFYLFFEMSLIPIFIIILGWGYQPERIQAGMYMFFYMIIASLPMLLFLFNYYKMFNSLMFFFDNEIFSFLMFFMVNTVFLVKIPMFIVHLWLPKAHVEAPISGSMILAGVMLKLGGYGLLRFLSFFLNLGLKINFIFINISILGGIFISLLCLRQSDLKSLIAYSSVVHMGLMLSGMFTFSKWGLVGSLIMMISHGLCSSGLFVLVNLNYERFLSRSIFINKGMINIAPSLTLWWFLLVSSNMAFPPSLNLLSELILISSLVNYSYILMFLLMLISFFSAVYSLYLYSFSQHGNSYIGLFSFFNISVREYLLLFLHWLPLNLMFLKLDLFNF